MKKLIAAIATILVFASSAFGQAATPIAKNTTLKFCGSIYDATTAKRLTAAVTGIDCEFAQVTPASTDESAFADLSTGERVVGTVGQFCYTIASTEDNFDGEIRVSCKASNSSAADYERTFTTLTPLADSSITAAAIATDAIGAAEIAADAIGASEIATDAIGAAEIATDAIGASELAANAIGAAELADASIDAATFAAGAIDASAIATDAIGAAEIAANAIGASEVADDSIDAGAIAASAIGAAEIATDAITAAKIADAALDSATFAADGTAQAGGSDSTHIQLASAETYADNVLTGREVCIVAGTGKGECREILSNVGATDTAAVASWTAPDGTSQYVIGSMAKFSSVSVTLGAGSITSSTFAAGAIDAAAIAADAIGASEIAADAIGASEIAADAIGSSELAADAIGASEIATDAIGAAEIAANAISDSELGDTLTFAMIGNITGNLSGTIGGLGATAKSDVNAEVLDVMNVDTYAELAACPAATASPITMLRFAFMVLRNRLEDTATAHKLLKDDGTSVLCTYATSDDGTTFVRGEGS